MLLNKRPAVRQAKCNFLAIWCATSVLILTSEFETASTLRLLGRLMPRAVPSLRKPLVCKWKQNPVSNKASDPKAMMVPALLPFYLLPCVLSRPLAAPAAQRFKNILCIKFIGLEGIASMFQVVGRLRVPGMKSVAV